MDALRRLSGGNYDNNSAAAGVAESPAWGRWAQSDWEFSKARGQGRVKVAF